MADKVYDLRAGDHVTHYKHGNGNVVRALENGLVEVRFGKRTGNVEFRNLVSTERLELEERTRREREREAALLREEERKRWDRGIPSYAPGHIARVEAIFARAAKIPGLHLNCNAYRGIAMNDCARNSRELAVRIAAS